MSEKRQSTLKECILVEGLQFNIGEKEYLIKKVGCLVPRNIITSVRTKKEANPPKDSICEVSIEDANKIAEKLIEDYNKVQKQLDHLRSRILNLKTYTPEDYQEYNSTIDERQLEGLSETAKEFVKESLRILL